MAGVFVFLYIFLAAADITAQPEARLALDPQEVHLNRLLHLNLELAWEGEADVYDIPRPDLSAIPDFKIVGQSISATRKGDKNMLNYHLVLKPLKEGTYDLNRMKVTYYEKGKDIPTAIDLPSAIIQVRPPQALGYTAEAGIAAGLSLALCTAAGYIVIRSKKKAQRGRAAEIAANDRTRARIVAEIEGTRRLLLEGETGRYLEALCGILESEALRAHAEKLDELRELANSVKYSGQAASPDQLKWAEKLVKETVEKAFPHPDDEMEEL